MEPPKYAISESFVESDIPKKVRKVRGCNKNKKVASLKQGEKLDISFYNNRVVGKNQAYWSRHLGKIVRDHNIYPVRVKSWMDISDITKKHMWDTVIEYFKHPDIESYYLDTLDHMRELWGNWRSDLNTKYVKTCKSKLEAIKNVPRGVDSKDWEWLINNLLCTPEYQRISARNSKNRAAKQNLAPHRCGSMPHREMIYEMGGKEGNPPDVREIFLKTRKIDENSIEPEISKKCDEIAKTMESEPFLNNLQVVEKCFGRQHHGHVFGYGGGIKRKNFESTSQNEELKAKLREKEEQIREKENEELKAKLREKEEQIREKEEENRVLMIRFEQFENRLIQMENERSNVNTSSTNY